MILLCFCFFLKQNIYTSPEGLLFMSADHMYSLELHVLGVPVQIRSPLESMLLFKRTFSDHRNACADVLRSQSTFAGRFEAESWIIRAHLKHLRPDQTQLVFRLR